MCFTAAMTAPSDMRADMRGVWLTPSYRVENPVWATALLAFDWKPRALHPLLGNRAIPADRRPWHPRQAPADRRSEGWGPNCRLGTPMSPCSGRQHGRSF